MFAEVNYLKEGYVMHLTSGKRENTEVQQKNINIWEFKIKQQLLDFLQNRYISFHCEHKKDQLCELERLKHCSMGILEDSQPVTLLPDTLAPFSLPEKIHSNEILIFDLFLFFHHAFALTKSVGFFHLVEKSHFYSPLNP